MGFHRFSSNEHRALVNCDGLEIQMTIPCGRKTGVNELEEQRKVSVSTGTDVIQWVRRRRTPRTRS